MKETNQWKEGDECWIIDINRYGISITSHKYYSDFIKIQSIMKLGIYRTKEEAKQYLIDYINSL